MATKRGNGDDDLSGREKKKLKMSAARTIAVQSAVPASGSRGLVAGPSKATTKGRSSMSGLPSAIDVEKFVEARAYEIDAMHKAMKAASASSTCRAWQTLPRHLRRRAASHNARRVPLRLRDKARFEMDPVKKRSLARMAPQRSKHVEVKRTDSLRKRQVDKAWLETHIWHAKRMHMENMWGYRLAVTPTEKAYRPSHRASMHGAILHDASYYSLVEIRGAEDIIVAMLESCCDPQAPSPGSKRCSTGSRTLETHIYKSGCYPFELVAPLTIIWQPPEQQDDSVREPVRNPKGKGKEKEVELTTSPSRTSDRVVWLRFHPCVHIEVFDVLKEAASLALDQHRRSNPSPGTLKISDLKGHVNIFEITGPKASQVIKGALSPVSSEDRDSFLKFWSSLANLKTAGSLPRGMIIGFKVEDPRLKFPPKNVKDNTNSHLSPSPNITFPSAALANSEIWVDSVRNGLAKPRFQKKDLDERRSKNAVPGTRLSAHRQDDRIPVLLVQNSLEGVGTNQSSPIHGWTLIIPAGWSMAFWNSLIFTGTRLGGQREKQVQAYEAGVPYFPRDFPSTEAYNSQSLVNEISQEEAWGRKPPAKRVNFEKLDTPNPWKADWEHVLGIVEGSGIRGPDFVSTQREEPEGGDGRRIQPWLLRGPDTLKILSTMSSVFNHGATLLSEINKLRLKRNQTLLSAVNSADLLKGALITVSISICSRGTPDDLAMIHTIPNEDIKKWEKALQCRKRGGISLDEDVPEELELVEVAPPSGSLIGYVTTGHYSLARGRGFAIGTVSLGKMLELEQRLLHDRNTQSHSAPTLVVLRNPNSSQYRAAYIKPLTNVT